MMINRNLILGLLIAIFSLPMASYGQAQANLKKANRLYDKLAYSQAIPYYKKHLEKHTTQVAMERIAHCYRLIGQLNEAVAAYTTAVSFGGATPECLLEYAHTLKNTGKYKEAGIWYREYKPVAVDEKQAMYFMAAMDSLASMMEKNSGFTIKPMEFNTENSEMGVAIHGNGLVIASNKKRKGAMNQTTDPRSSGYFYDLYFIEKNLDKTFKKAVMISGKVNSKYHDGPATIAPDGSMYLTRSNFLDGKIRDDANGINKLKIFRALPDGMGFGEIQNLNFNNDNYSIGHPAISADGQWMVFASDMPGGFGGTDLYRVKSNGETWGLPENLGPDVNTDGDELFPTLPVKGMLYFSSDHHIGFGGLDIFSCSWKNGKVGNVKNLGQPVNSAADDFGIVWEKRSNTGYFNSNRTEGQSDDIFFFEKALEMKGMVVASKSGKPLEGISVEIMDSYGKIFKYTTDEEGGIAHPCEGGKEYYCTIVQNGFAPKKEKIIAPNNSSESGPDFTIGLEKQFNLMVFGSIRDLADGNFLEDATVEIHREAGEMETVMSGEKGDYAYKLEENASYFAIISKEGYIPEVKRFSSLEMDEDGGVSVNAYLTKGDYTLVEGQVVTFERGQPVSGAALRVIDNRTLTIHQNLTSGVDGKFWISIPWGSTPDFSLVASENGYFTSRIDIERDHKTGDKKAIIALKLADYGVDKVVKSIYFGYNKSNLNVLSKRDINEITYFLFENPNAVVELGAHTDSRGTKLYNLRLSQQRAETVVEYIVDNRKVPIHRIDAKGYGEEFLLNDCDDYKECTEEGHAINRRAEIKVIRILHPGELQNEEISEADR